MFTFGIEHEVAFVHSSGAFADFANTPFAAFDQIIAQLPLYCQDYPQLHVGDAGIRLKRWYIEGVERFSEDGRFVTCVPKGIEIRTTLHTSIQGVIDELATSFRLLRAVAATHGMTPVLVSFNPYRSIFVYDPPLNAYEYQLHQEEPDRQTEHFAMLTYGPDLNFSAGDLSSAAALDIGRKLTFYSPFIVPFSYSAPFYNGALWHGLSARTFLRTGQRPVVRVFIDQDDQMLIDNPSLTKLARTPCEAGRIEFKACDSCDDLAIYAGLLALLKGLALDQTLPGRATLPDEELNIRSAQHGFADEEIWSQACTVLEAAQTALQDDHDACYLAPLIALLERRETPAHAFIRKFQQSGSILPVLQQTYQHWQ
jgi:gamma-glutamyl:cysteine ligase YbdK (ATP-grasp superfamily)